MSKSAMANTGPAPAPTPPGSNSTLPPCPLEELNVDCMIAILSSINSLADLSAFIRASPAIFACFLSSKSSILIHALTRELGPAVRDALVLYHTEDIDMLAAGTIHQTLDIAVGAYRQCLQADKWPWIPAQDIETAVGMARVARVALYFTDLYLRQQIPHINHALNDPATPGSSTSSTSNKWNPTPTEHKRITQSLLRLQILTTLYYPAFHNTSPSPPSELENDRSFLTLITPLFPAWSLDQISSVAVFLSHLIEAFRHLDRHMPRNVSAPASEYYRVHYHKMFFFNLSAFSAVLGAAQREEERAGEEEGGFMARLLAVEPSSYGPRLIVGWLETSPSAPSGGGVSLLPGVVGDEDEDGAGQVEFDRESPTDPPWAWVHAWNGRRQVRRWGTGLVPAHARPGRDAEHSRAMVLMKSWRELGLVFWDRQHAEELLLRAKDLEGCRAGWLLSGLDSGWSW